MFTVTQKPFVAWGFTVTGEITVYLCSLRNTWSLQFVSVWQMQCSVILPVLHVAEKLAQQSAGKQNRTNNSLTHRWESFTSISRIPYIKQALITDFKRITPERGGQKRKIPLFLQANLMGGFNNRSCLFC